MSGILDSKSRIIDTVITTEGRRQLSEGGVDIKYVSFTDGATYYRADADTGSEDATKRLYLESCQLPQDDIVFRADDDGNLQPFRSSDDVPTAGGRILDYSFNAVSGSTFVGFSQDVITLQGAAFEDGAELLLSSSLKNFKRMMLIATRDTIFDDDGFALGPNDVTFAIHDNRPIAGAEQQTTHVSALDSIFSDPRFSTRPNFKFLPPINKTNDTSLDRSDHREFSKLFLGWYFPWGRTQVFGLTYKQTMAELAHYSMMGYERVINFDPSSRDNQLVGQFFERTANGLKKLDVVHFGNFHTGNDAAPIADIFFVGKVEVDEKGTDTFLHLFTLVFE
jgi:hypothetical protein